MLEPGKPVLLRGSVSGRERDEGDPPVFLDEIVPLDSVYASGRVAVCLEIEGSAALEGNRLEEAIKIVRAHPGPAALQVVVQNGGDEPSRLRSRGLKVAPVPDVLAELRTVLGEGRVRLVEA